MPHIIIILMTSAACLSQARDQEIYQAKIYVDKNKHRIEITCSTHGLKKTDAKDSNFYIYLCRNGTGIDVKSSCQDATFYIDDTTKDSTGDYSCVFSVNKKNPSDVRGKGINSIFITVNDSFIPAEIALLETNVKTGDDVVFQCTSVYISSERTQKGNIYAYLSKNSTVIQMTIWNTIKNNIRFTINEVTMQDAGTYACFLMSEPCPFPKKVHSINEVNLHVHVNGTIKQEKDNETLKITVGVVFMLLLIFLPLGLWTMYRKQDCIKVYCERPSGDDSDSIDSGVNQDQLQNAQSFSSEWDDSKNSDRDSSDDVYQNCPRQPNHSS